MRQAAGHNQGVFPEGFPPPDLELVSDVPFSAHGLKLDVLRPRQRASEAAPVILHLHGGGWVMYGKWPVDNVFLARAGFVTVSVDYRLAPDSTFPAQLHDAKAAVRWLRAHADELGIDPGRIGAWGISAGGHLAALMGVTAGDTELEGLDGGWAGYSSAVQAVGSVCGPMNLLAPDLTTPGEVLPLLGGTLKEKAALGRQASPLAHISAGAPPFCLIHGTQDDVVPVSQAREMHAALAAAGVKSELSELSGDHYINETHRAAVEARLLAFFEAELGPVAGN